MKDWQINFLYKIIVFILFFFSPIIVLKLLNNFDFYIQNYIILYFFQIIILTFSYFLYEFRLRLYFSKTIKKIMNKNSKFNLNNSTYRNFFGFDSFSTFEYFFNEEIDKLFNKITELEYNYNLLDKNKSEKLNFQEEQTNKLINKITKDNNLILKKDFLLDAFLQVFDALENSNISYDMFFDEISFYLTKYFDIKELIIYKNSSKGFKIFSQLSNENKISEEILNKIKNVEGGIFVHTDYNYNSGYNFIINLKNYYIHHGVIFININDTEYLENELLFKLTKAIIQGFTHMLNNLYFVKQLNLKLKNKDKKIEELNLKLKDTENNLELQLDEVSNMYEEIVTLYKIGKEIGKIYNKKELEEKIIELSLDIIEAEFGLIYYYEHNNIKISSIVNVEDSKLKAELKLLSRMENIFFFIKNSDKEVIVNNVSILPNFSLLPSTLRKKLKNFLEVPLFNGKKIIGGIILFNKETEFSAANVSFLTSLANQISIAVQNIDFLNKEIERRKEEEQLKIASQIQAGLFPQEMPKPKNGDFYGINIPAKAVGGDYYDLIQINENIVIGIVADVSGKGIPASLLMSMLKTTFKMSITKLNEFSPEKILSLLNDYLITENLNGKFVTAVCFKIDTEKQEIELSNAGHDPVLHYDSKNNTILEYQAGGTVLGFLEETFEKEIIKYNKDDVFLLYTDGVVEARSLNNDFFEFERLYDSIKKYHQLNAKALIENLMFDIKKFTNGNKQNDDITILAIKGL
ncbi:GAF domain-containing protein [Hypnocyclicus thermotrophus]|uniref:GAF domain-containing protein n=2 Tax=Hypnocyclicus thermotrophus TaxID=1627895 RepID=A0AA46I561_9FUSO|nr:GAF domain-containing protein [Hypnocyclicus thermotrophus]